MQCKTHEHRTSLYLVRRAEALHGALKYFRADSSDAVVRRLRFLAQLDFWDWEMENLIYSFTNLAERSKTWSNHDAAVRKLGQMGIRISTRTIKSVHWKGIWRIRAQEDRVAPVELLQEVIELWNSLLGLCEQHFLIPMLETAEKFGIETRKDLGAFQKKMPELPASVSPLE